MDDSTILNALESNIGRIVAALTPVFTAIVAAGAFWLQDVIGVDMQQYVPAVVAFVALVATSAFGSALVWLRNRGNWEKQVVETATLAKLGEQELSKAAARDQNFHDEHYDRLPTPTPEMTPETNRVTTAHFGDSGVPESGPGEAEGNPGEDPSVPYREPKER